MNWETVKISTSNRGRTTPYASVGFGRISLSAAACELIADHEHYHFAELLRGKANNNLCIGIRLLKEASDNSLRITRKKTPDGKPVTGMDISNKAIVEELFGPAGSAKKTTRYEVKRDSETANILIIYAS